MQASNSDTRYGRMSQTTSPAGGMNNDANIAMDSELVAAKEYFKERTSGLDLLKSLEDVGGLTFELDPDHESIHAHAPHATRLLISRREAGYISVCTWAYITVHDRKPATLTLVDETVTPGDNQPIRRLLRWDEVPSRPLVSPFEACMEATNNNVPLLKGLVQYYFLWKGVVSWEELVYDNDIWFLAELYDTLLKMKKSAAQTEGPSVETPDTKRPETPATPNKLLPFSRAGAFRGVDHPSVSAKPSLESLALQRHGSETPVGQMQRSSLFRDIEAGNYAVGLSDRGHPITPMTPQEKRIAETMSKAGITDMRSQREAAIEAAKKSSKSLASTPSTAVIASSKRKASFNKEKIQKLLAIGEKMQGINKTLEELEAQKFRLEKEKQGQQKEFEEHFGDLTPWEVMEFMTKRSKKG